MPPCRDKASDANAKNANAYPLLLDQEVSNVKFRNAIQMLAPRMTNKKNQVHTPLNINGGEAALRVHDFVRMNLAEFLES